MGLDQPQVGSAPHPKLVALLPPGGKGRVRRRVIVLGISLLLAAFIVAIVLSAAYQPLTFGGEAGGSFAGLPSGVGLRQVNTFAGSNGELFIPPQGGTFTISTSIMNNGPESVTIEAVAPGPPAEPSATWWPFRSAGRVHYAPFEFPTALHAGTLGSGLSIPPGEAISIGVPVRFSNDCFEASGWATVTTLWVKERYLTFTQWVEIPIGQTLVAQEPVPRGSPASTCVR